AAERGGRHFADGPQDGCGDGDVQRRVALAHVCRGEVDGNGPLFQQHTDPRERAGDAHPRLANRGLCEPHHLKEGGAPRTRHLDRNGLGLQTYERARLHGAEAERLVDDDLNTVTEWHAPGTSARAMPLLEAAPSRAS